MDVLIIFVICGILTLAILSDGSDRGCLNAGCGVLLFLGCLVMVGLALAGMAGVESITIGPP